MRFSPGDRISTYRVERELGATTTGTLYQAVHQILPRRAVIKVGHPARGQQFAIQLLREACLLEALSTIGGVPQVYESGLLDDRRPWFAFEQIEGASLAERLNGGPLASFEVAALLRDLARILELAHKRGIVHRALRPDRVTICGPGARPCRELSVAIHDWSEARAHDASSEPGMFVARDARAYVAPELARGELADDRADVYALGVVAYQALTGALPKGTEAQPFIPAADRCPEAPRELVSLIDQMLSPDRFDRPTCAEIRSDLEWLADALAIELRLADAPTAMRIRRPRWTPAIEPVDPYGRVLLSDLLEPIDQPSEDVSAVAGEIIILEVDD